jgi:hypothetical protein
MKQLRWNPLEPQNPYYWPHGVPAELTIAAFIQAYQTLGYEPFLTRSRGERDRAIDQE